MAIWEDDEPLTPEGRLLLQPEMNQVVHCVFGLKNSIDLEALKRVIKDSLMFHHPRFNSVLVRDEKGREHWRRTQLDLDEHVFLRDIGGEENDDDDDDERVVNDYLADLAVSSMSRYKPLWEVHVVKNRRCCVFRIHHAIGDGISLMSMFNDLCRKADQPEEMSTIPTFSSSISRSEREEIEICGRLKRIWRFCLRLVMVVWFTLIYAMEFLLRSLWVKDQMTTISGGEGVEMWPRKIATAKFSMDDMKTVKKALGNATINDVLCGVVSSGLSRYLDLKNSDTQLHEGTQISGLLMVNIREQSGLQELSKLVESSKSGGTRWGNQFGYVIFPVCYHRKLNDPLQHVKRAKAMMDKKKLSLEAHLSYWVVSLLSPKLALYLTYRIVCNTTFAISNIPGPNEERTLAGNPINYIRVNISTLPCAIIMHMVSYAGRADMQILVAKDIIPDPELLAKCFEDALLEMKDAAANSTEVQEGLFF